MGAPGAPRSGPPRTSTASAHWRDAPEPVAIWAAMLAGHGWRPGALTFSATSLTMGLSSLLRR
eukprot:9709174-Alexandrium_andersonii.AAC.1